MSLNIHRALMRDLRVPYHLAVLSCKGFVQCGEPGVGMQEERCHGERR